MLKNILNLKGALEITKSEQKTIKGGYLPDGCQYAFYPGKSVDACKAIHGSPIFDSGTHMCRVLICNP